MAREKISKKFGENGFAERLFQEDRFFMPPHQPDSTPVEAPENQVAAAILDQHEKSLLLYISGKLGAEGANLVPDIWQEVALAVHRHRFDSTAVDDPLNWLRRIASNKIADHWRTTYRGRQADTKWAENQLGGPHEGGGLRGALDWILHQSSRERVRGALAGIGEEERRLLREKYLEGYTVAEIAGRAGVGEKVIEHRLAQARASFREKISQEL